MTEDKPKTTLEDLDARLRQAQARRAPGKSRHGETRAEGSQSGMGIALRIGVELVAGLIVGTGVGWLLDRWLGTAPWLMILFFVLGAAAGMMNVYRTMSGIGHGVGYQPRKDGDTDEKPGNRDDGTT